MTQTHDIVDLLSEDHRDAERLLDELCSAAPEERDGLFWKLVPALVRHEVAEEMVVYPAISQDAAGGEAQVQARLSEQEQAERKLATMEVLDPTTVEFADEAEGLRQTVMEHAAAEEAHVFPLLRGLGPSDVRQDLGLRYEKAKAHAPTHPHPETPHKVVGRMAALFDRARDALRADRSAGTDPGH